MTAFFIDHAIDHDTLLDLTQNNIAEIIPKLGYRKKFELQHANYVLLNKVDSAYIVLYVLLFSKCLQALKEPIFLEPGDDTNSTETSISNDSLLSASCSTSSNNEIYHDDENQLITITNMVANPAKNVSIHTYVYMCTVNSKSNGTHIFIYP